MSWTSLIGWVVVPQIGGILGGLATATQIKTWYEVNRLTTNRKTDKYLCSPTETVETVVATPKCSFWTGMDNSVSFYGHCFVFSRTRWSRISKNIGVNLLFHPINIELVLDTGVFRFSSIGSCEFE